MNQPDTKSLDSKIVKMKSFFNAYSQIINIILEFQSMKIIESTEKYIDETFMNFIQKKKGLCDIVHYNETLMNTIM